MKALKRLVGFILTVLFCIAFGVEIILYTLRWLITGLPVPEQPKSTKVYQWAFNYLKIR